MTRINVGILPSELCDQHLIAEYRELPRMAAYSRLCLQRGNEYDMPFTLGAGHMKSCMRYGEYLAARHVEILVEMRFRGFKPSYDAIYNFAYWHMPSGDWIIAATKLVRTRIFDRLHAMKREPTWTDRSRPLWSIYAV